MVTRADRTRGNVDPTFHQIPYTTRASRAQRNWESIPSPKTHRIITRADRARGTADHILHQLPNDTQPTRASRKRVATQTLADSTEDAGPSRKRLRTAAVEADSSYNSAGDDGPSESIAQPSGGTETVASPPKRHATEDVESSGSRKRRRVAAEAATEQTANVGGVENTDEQAQVRPGQAHGSRGLLQQPANQAGHAEQQHVTLQDAVPQLQPDWRTPPPASVFEQPANSRQTARLPGDRENPRPDLSPQEFEDSGLAQSYRHQRHQGPASTAGFEAQQQEGARFPAGPAYNIRSRGSGMPASPTNSDPPDTATREDIRRILSRRIDFSTGLRNTEPIIRKKAKTSERVDKIRRDKVAPLRFDDSPIPTDDDRCLPTPDEVKINRSKTEHPQGMELARTYFAQPSLRFGRQMMLEEEMEIVDLLREGRGEDNDLPRWKQNMTNNPQNVVLPRTPYILGEPSLTYEEIIDFSNNGYRGRIVELWRDTPSGEIMGAPVLREQEEMQEEGQEV